MVWPSLRIGATTPSGSDFSDKSLLGADIPFLIFSLNLKCFILFLTFAFPFRCYVGRDKDWSRCTTSKNQVRLAAFLSRGRLSPLLSTRSAALNDPSKVLYRAPNPCLEPEDAFETGLAGRSWVPSCFHLWSSFF